MAGAVDLLAGTQSIHGANLFQVDKSPLAQISGGIEDVIGKQAAGTGSSVITSFESILRAMLGFDPLQIPLEIGGQLLGTIGNIGMYFGNLETFLGELNPLDPHFDPIAAAITFITTIINPTNLLAGLVPNANGSAGLTGFIPLENLALDLIEGAIGGAQTVIDAILAAAGFPAGSGTTAEVDLLFTNLTAFLGDFTSGSFDPLAAAQTFITDILNPANLLATVADLTNLTNVVDELQGIVDGILAAIPGGELLQPLIDLLFNGLTSGNASNVPLGLLGQEIQSLQSAVGTSINLATRAFDVTQQFGGLLHMLFQQLDAIPNYFGWFDFIGQMEAVLAGVVNSIFTSLSPNNPPVAAANNQIAAIWAHIAAGSAGVHYAFDPAVGLTANYLGTSNPSWGIPTGENTPTVPTPTGTPCAVSASGRATIVFTGNPNGAALDHSLVTDRNQVYATIGNPNPGTTVIPFGWVELIMSASYVSGVLGAHVGVLLTNAGGGASMQMFTATGPTDHAFVTLQGTGVVLPRRPIDGDVIGIQYDGAGTYSMYFNNALLGSAAITATHGAGHRDIGMILFDNGFGSSTIGLGVFTALDYL